MGMTTAPPTTEIPELVSPGPRFFLARLLSRRVDIASLVAFRIAFGAIVLWEVSRYLERGWVLEYYVNPAYNFPYEGFEWVRPLPATGMIAVFAMLALCAFFFMVGLFYRTAALLVFLGLTYVFLLEQAVYLNHFYLLVLVGFLMVLVPAHHAYSLDATLGRVSRRDWAPAWSITLLQFQIGIVYFYGGIAKLNYDWLVQGEPLRHWLNDSQWFPLVGPLFAEPWAPYLVGWSGLAIDLLAPFLLLHRKSRPFMLTALLAFHFTNDRLFTIGVFPWFAIMASTVFLPADWPRRLSADFRARRLPILIGGAASLLLGLYMHQRFELVPALIAALGGAVVVWTFLDGFRPAAKQGQAYQSRTELPSAAAPSPLIGKALFVFLFAWVLVQALVPLRHFAIPGDVAWTEEGHRFSWRMKLRSKFGLAKFYAHDPATQTGFEIRVDSLLTADQYEEMSGKPHMIYQFAKFLEQRLKEEGKDHYQIRVAAFASVNYGPPGLMIDPSVNLTARSYSDFRHNSWIRHRPTD